MPLPAQWATPEDFATLFQYFWYRNFPIDQKAVGARRTDWTIHMSSCAKHSSPDGSRCEIRDRGQDRRSAAKC